MPVLGGSVCVFLHVVFDVCGCVCERERAWF